MRFSKALNGLIVSLGLVVVLMLVMNFSVAEFGRASSADGLTAEAWEERKLALREGSRARSRAATGCRLGMEKRIAEGRIANVDLAKLASRLDVRLGEIPAAYCSLFVHAIVSDQISYQEFVAWADEPPIDLPDRLAGRSPRT
ncbi:MULTISPECIES: hypothetical protein [unclassified Ensifer]|uniref:hypothetical protein n=1 Tax=unclassified Ensifer TaxID=2633371 RepID=UPI000813B6D6|nr:MULTISPECIES: hypothetical protein [unclassified Ensifer]OCP24555.1 hypothetical protein BC361_20445 [Ensifer sp. LC54]OCP26043.1 hypothetical protein BC363_18090 [Ensifer sp. LC384]